MKYLINAEGKAIRRGEFVKANADAGETILDTDDVSSEFTKDRLFAIAAQNLIKAPKNSNRNELIENITTNLEKQKMDEQNTPTQSEIISEIVKAAGEQREPGSDSDSFEVEVFTQCIQRLNEEGITFKIKQLGNLVKKEIAEQGLVVSTAQRKELAFAVLEGMSFEPATWDDVEAAIDQVLAECPDTERKQASSLVRRYAKQNEIELPKRNARAKKASGTFRSRLIDFMIANSPVTDEGLLEFCTEAGRKDPEKDVERASKLRGTIDAAVEFGRTGQVSEAA